MALSKPSRLLLLLAAVLAGAAATISLARQPPPRVAVLTPAGQPEITLMDFTTPFALDPPPSGWWHRKFWLRAPMTMAFSEKQGVAALRMETSGTASMLFRFVDIPLADYPVLKWRWYIEQPIVTPLDERTREGDDHPARFFLALKTDAGDDRRFEIIWGNRLHRGETKTIGTFPHYVADGGDENIRQWRDEEVDIAAVAKQFWPDIKSARLTDIALFCDSDETKSSSVAYVADVRIANR